MAYGDKIALRADPEKREGYTFSGWSPIPETMPMENVTVTGSWSINQYTVTFKSDTNVVYTTIKQDYNTAFEMPKEELVKTGYTFKGWAKSKNGKVVYKNKKAVKNLVKNGKTVKLYAKWAKKK